MVGLAAEGLVHLVPNRGARVAPIGWNDIREHLEAFDVSQRLVTRWAAVRIDGLEASNGWLFPARGKGSTKPADDGPLNDDLEVMPGISSHHNVCATPQPNTASATSASANQREN
jgi:hypothetical protein